MSVPRTMEETADYRSHSNTNFPFLLHTDGLKAHCVEECLVSTTHYSIIRTRKSSNPMFTCDSLCIFHFACVCVCFFTPCDGKSVGRRRGDTGCGWRPRFVWVGGADQHFTGAALSLHVWCYELQERTQEEERWRRQEEEERVEDERGQEIRKDGVWLMGAITLWLLRLTPDLTGLYPRMCACTCVCEW